ncbi:DAK2 domain-containing protein [Haloimpatiens lingqiaonensis]|uniref:DAK2 domain-containing protein n=1 Tax=Haloimpatiens lingqiaonensis TaxID=1380675 RepID=UPI0010FDC31F|nr:DAK2 domain-containing protein [Haloimpatiens lingqiaonensis]
MEHLYIDGRNFYNMIINASNKLEEQKEFVNSLNVFPVPDGDTGTNMSMTLKTAVSEIEELKGSSLDSIAKKLAKGALMGARGNSGVIFSQIVRGISKGMEGKEKISAKEFGNSLVEGSKFAYKAVMRPTEGTILTIIRAAGESASKSSNVDIVNLLEEVCNYSEEILNKTPEMLPALKEAKVVDAGGMGLLIILKAMKEALETQMDYTISKEASEAKTQKAAINTIKTESIKFGYCTEFFVISNNIDVEEFKSELEKHGDSMVVVGLDDVVKVHIHTNDPGLILSKAVKLGELSKIKIENMREQHRHILVKEDEIPKEISEPKVELKKYAFIPVAMGEGITNIFRDLGADEIIEGGQTMNPSTQDILESINKLNAENIFILPNNKNIIMSANQAAELSDKKVYVIPTKTIPQGISAITVFNSEVEAEENIDNMNEAIKNVKTGKVTYAVRDTENEGKIIKQGDILGLVEDKIEEVGSDVYTVCEEIASKIMDEDKELITVLYGRDADDETVNKLVERMEEKYPDVDIQSYSGKQPLYYFIISAE